MRPDVVLFDLDGTLTESAPGITRSIAYALNAVGVPPLDDAVLLRFVGPPLAESFRELAGLDRAGVEAAIRAYREYFVERGMFENSVYPGIADLLSALADEGRRMAVATSKPTRFAAPIVEHFALAGYFEAVFGPDGDDAPAAKAESVREALVTMNPPSGSRAVLVGDRSHDVEGAHAVGIPCIGVLWGYGSHEELAAAGADEIVPDVDALARSLGVTIPGAASPASQPPPAEEARAG